MKDFNWSLFAACVIMGGLLLFMFTKDFSR